MFEQALSTVILLVVLLLAAAAMLWHLKREFFYPRPGIMPAALDEDLDGALARFQAALAEHAPAVLEGLSPGLSDEDIRAIEDRYRLRLTGEMRAFYRWRNGSPREMPGELIPGKWFVPLEEAAAVREGLRQQVSEGPMAQRIAYWIFASHRNTWLQILDDRCGDGYFYDPSRRRGPGSFFYHFAEDRQYRFFPSLVNFLAGATECYEKGIYRSGRRGAAAENFERSLEVWSRYTT